MAQHQYDVPLGGKKTDVVLSGGSAISDALSVTVDDTASPSKEQALEAIEAVKHKIVEGTWPPA